MSVGIGVGVGVGVDVRVGVGPIAATASRRRLLIDASERAAACLRVALPRLLAGPAVKTIMKGSSVRSSFGSAVAMVVV